MRILFGIWLTISLFLTFSMFGMLLFVPRKGRDESLWVSLGSKLFKKTVKF